MSVDELKEAVKAIPFEPFALRTIDGRKVPVRNRDFILISPTSGHAIVFQPDNSREMFDIALIPGIEYGPPPPSAAAINPSQTQA